MILAHALLTCSSSRSMATFPVGFQVSWKEFDPEPVGFYIARAAKMLEGTGRAWWGLWQGNQLNSRAETLGLSLSSTEDVVSLSFSSCGSRPCTWLPL